MKVILYATIFALFFSSPVWADELDEVSALTKEKITILIGLLKNKELDKETRNQKVVDEIKPIFDFPRMAKLSLGKKYWSQMNAEQKKEFSNLFVQRMQESYLEKLELYTDEEVEFQEAKKVKKRIHVMTHLLTKDDKLEMLYKLYKSKTGWKIYDVEILGVSVIQTYRSQLGGILKKGNIEDLLAQLRNSGGLTIPTN